MDVVGGGRLPCQVRHPLVVKQAPDNNIVKVLFSGLYLQSNYSSLTLSYPRLSTDRLSLLV